MRTLTDRLPATRDPGALLDAFLEWTFDRGIELYPAQEEAILEVFEGHHVILNTPTGSGKSMVAIAAHFYAMARGERSVYTSPIKALVSEKFFDLCNIFGAQHVGMSTGDAAINASAPIVCCTAEILAKQALRRGRDAGADLVIMDEFHYYGDRDRGMAWQVPLLELRDTAFLLMSATLGDTSDVVARLEARSGRQVVLVRGATRPVPLQFSWSEAPLIEAIVDQAHHGKAPIYVVNFTQREAAELAQSLTSFNLSTTEEKKKISEAVGGFRFDSPYGRKIRRYVQHGIGLHHAGLLPKYRLLTERLAQQGLLKVICGTDTLGVGVNVPIRTVLFTRLYKYDGQNRRILSVRDFQQIAGRAGRKGYDDQGWVVCQAPAHIIENKKLEAKNTVGGKTKKFQRKQPDKHYVAYDEATFERLANGVPEALHPVFEIDHGTILNLLQRDPANSGKGGGYGDLVRLIAQSHEPPARQARLRRQSARLFRALFQAGLVNTVPRVVGRGSRVELSDELQDDFSVFQTLALFLLEVLPELDLDDPDFALMVVTFSEAILENPTQVLAAQAWRARGERLQELKAEGMEYEERQEALETVGYPKPFAELIYENFNAFSERHPWVGEENIRPKSIVREMYERWATFNDYVGELGLELIEGILLRYLSEVYRTLVRTVPEPYHDETLRDLTAWLRTTIDRVDSSLIQEWEKLMEPADDSPLTPRRPRDPWADPKEFQRRIRAQMHQLVRELSLENWEACAEVVRGDAEDPWDADRFRSELGPYFAEHSHVVFDHGARLSDRTQIRSLGDRQWEVIQRLVDPAGDDDWMVEARLDFRQSVPEDGLWLEVVRIGR